jgi:hypothetical protein
MFSFMEQHVFNFIHHRGHHRKGVTIYSATEVNLQPKTLVSLNRKCSFEHYKVVKAIKNQLIDIILVRNFFSDDLNRAIFLC